MISLLLAFQAATTPADFPALMNAMAEDMRKLKSYRDEWLLVVEAGSQKVQMRVLRSIDGERGGLLALTGPDPILWVGSDGKRSFYISPGQEIFGESNAGNAWFKRKPVIEPPTLKEGDFNVNFDGIYDLSITSKPTLKLIGIENSIVDGEKARKATLEAKRASGGSVTLQLWFDEKRWVPIRAEANVKNSEGGGSKFWAFRTRKDEAATFTAEDFSYPEKTVEGFTRVDWRRLVPGP